MELSAEEQFIESLGLFMENLGFSRIAGRILGFLLCQGVAMPLDGLAEALRVSRASISTNTRLLIQVRLIEECSMPGDRRSWFRMRPDAFQQRLSFIIMQFGALSGLLEQGLAAVPPERAQARRNLTEAVAFHRMLVLELSALNERWQEQAALTGNTEQARLK